MNKKEYLEKLDKLNLDKDKYCIISGGVMLMHNLKDKTNDIDIKILPEYFEELKSIYTFNKSPKYSYLYELGEDVETAVQDFTKDDIDIIDGYPVLKLEIELDWKIKNNREKDQESIKIIKKYLGRE